MIQIRTDKKSGKFDSQRLYSAAKASHCSTTLTAEKKEGLSVMRKMIKPQNYIVDLLIWVLNLYFPGR